MKKFSITFKYITILTFGFFLLALTGYSENEISGFSKELKQVLENKIELLQNIAKDPCIIEKVKISNSNNRDFNLSEILETDKKWQETEGLDDFIKSLLTNESAQYLIDFQEKHDEFVEIFITDKKGLVIGETNKTSDYYQADEPWWIKAYNQGTGNTFYGEIEYDESALAESIPIYIPVIDPGINKAIGVIKAVCDITAIKMEL
ncbi:MAG: hypothetical protein PVJ20_09225 [Desulfobacterales bacterium]|jgi:hypothetical protein